MHNFMGMNAQIIVHTGIGSQGTGIRGWRPGIGGEDSRGQMTEARNQRSETGRGMRDEGRLEEKSLHSVVPLPGEAVFLLPSVSLKILPALFLISNIIYPAWHESI